MKVFDTARRIETRESFLQSKALNRLKNSGKHSDAEIEDLCGYILSDECVRDIERIERGDYYLDYPKYRLVSKNFQKKKRAIYFMEGRQGFLMKYLVFAMRGIEVIYSDRLFSFRPDKSAGSLLREFAECRDTEKMYILKTDVSNYVGSIVPELLIPMLEDVFLSDDPAFFHFLKWMLTRNKVIDMNGEVIDHCPGGLGGIPFGTFFMNLYLHEMDEYYAPRAAFYSRYSDDILICARTFDEIRAYEEKFYEFLDRLLLTTNKEKTGILMPGEPFDLLGMKICEEKISISDHSILKIKRKLRMYTKKALVRKNRGMLSTDEAARDMIERYHRLFFGIRGMDGSLTWARWAFPMINDTECLKEIDHYFQNSLRYVLYGSMKKRNKSVPYEKLGELGYKSLVYYYHHPDQIANLIEQK